MFCGLIYVVWVWCALELSHCDTGPRLHTVCMLPSCLTWQVSLAGYTDIISPITDNHSELRASRFIAAVGRVNVNLLFLIWRAVHQFVISHKQWIDLDSVNIRYKSGGSGGLMYSLLWHLKSQLSLSVVPLQKAKSLSFHPRVTHCKNGDPFYLNISAEFLFNSIEIIFPCLWSHFYSFGYTLCVYHLSWLRG